MRQISARGWRSAVILFLQGFAFLASGSSVADSESMSLSKVPAGAPNVVIVLLDDVGFSATSTFGGPVKTPALDALAKEGLRYNRFHTTAICSPTRASLLTGRDSHATNVGTVLNTANALPGYQGMLRAETATIAEVLRQNGYATAAFGKWHLAPTWETSQAGPFDRWPTGVGFDKFYGFLGGETDQYEPTLYDGTRPIHRPPGDNYHLSEDIVEQAVRWVDATQGARPDKPFFLYLAPGATHAPLQVAKPWIDKYNGAFDGGWDVLREANLARQKALGIVPADTVLTPRPAQMPAWDSLSEDQQRVSARFMQTYAGFLEHTDVQIGRLIQSLKQRSQFDNTLFVYIAGDNGSGSAGGPMGSINYAGALQGLPETLQQQLAAIDTLGDKQSFPQYPVGWGWALTSPFQWVKQVASHLGGTRVGTVISWPRKISKQAGGLRSQFAHVNDIVPTILDAIGLEAPETVNGVAQLPMDGSSLLASLSEANAAEHHPKQLFEVYGHRAMYHRGWMASAFHQRLPWSVGVAVPPTPMEDDRWELYHLDTDYSQSKDLAETHPQKLAELQAMFREDAARLGILPLRSAMDAMHQYPPPNLAAGRKEFTYRAGAVGIPENNAPPIKNRSWSLHARWTGDAPRGVLATMGGTVGGWSLYLDGKSRPVFHYKTFERDQITLQGKRSLHGEQHLSLVFDYDGGGYARGGVFTLRVNGKPVDSGRIGVTPPSYFSIDETFDVGLDTGSPAGTYPPDTPLGYPFNGGILDTVTIQLN